LNESLTPIQVFCTADQREVADRIARGLVERRLAACVQILGPISSVYRWEGAIESAQEWLIIAKSRSDQYEPLQAAIRELHTYQVPEILAVPVVAGLPDYARWLYDSIDSAGP
jgi:periplasmic divalent cation tolerance protein